MKFWDNFQITSGTNPRYVAICDALAEAIEQGRLGSGRRLPSHRMLARKLGVSVGTITKAYDLALERGLITGEVGRGSFVRAVTSPPLAVSEGTRFPAIRVDLYQNLPVPIPPHEHEAWAETLKAMVAETDLAAMARTSWSEVSSRNRRTGAAWVRRTGWEPREDLIFDCPGVQCAISSIVGAISRPGDVAVTACLSHPGIKAYCEQYGVKLIGLPVDREGLDLDALECACREHSPRFLYCNPTIHTPTTATLSDERRRQLAEIASRHDVYIIEDESAAFVLPDPPLPVSAYAPAHSFFVADVWLALSLGLRTTYVVVPSVFEEAMARSIVSTSGTTPALTAEVAARWIDSDIADRLIGHRRAELAARNALARQILGHGLIRGHEYGQHLWLEPPEPWQPQSFAERARAEGIALVGADWFFVGHGKLPNGVRVSICNASDRDALTWALERLRDILAGPPRP